MPVLEVPVALPGIAAAQDEVEAWAGAAGVPQPVAMRLRLVLEELLVNLVMHARFGHLPGGAPPPARLDIGWDGHDLRVALDDAAEPFDPRGAPEPAVATLDDDRLGGLGLALVRRMTVDLDYATRPAGGNRTSFRIRTSG